MVRLFGKKQEIRLNPYNQLERISTGRFSKQQFNELLNDSRDTLTKIQSVVLDAMMKDKLTTGEEIRAFRKVTPLTWPPERVIQVVKELSSLRPEITKMAKTTS